MHQCTMHQCPCINEYDTCLCINEYDTCIHDYDMYQCINILCINAYVSMNMHQCLCINEYAFNDYASMPMYQ